MANPGQLESEYLLANRAYWDEQAASFAERGPRAWARGDMEGPQALLTASNRY
jgi:hypothetical protein